MRLFFAALACLCCQTALTAEGMWQPEQLPDLKNELQALGLEVAPEHLDDLTDHPMAAIVQLVGCSASFVSPDGLAVTNHHCVQQVLQHNSTPEANILEDGYLAEQRDDELPGNPGARMLVTQAVTDVSADMLRGLDADIDGLQRHRILEEREKQLIAECEREEGFRCGVHAFYQGLEFRLIKQLEIRDVRLVHAPPRSVGNYGGDIDNWMWPRHTGDYSFLRAYVAPDGSPADYAEDNVPYNPEHYLAVSVRGLKSGDFVMAAGYPGTTYRHKLALEAADVSRWYYPTRKRLYEEMLAIIQEQTAERPDAEIKYSSLMQGINNVTKNYQGMIEGFAQSGLVERKQRNETQLAEWLALNEAVEDDQPSSLARLKALVEEYRAEREQRMIYNDFLRRRAALLGVAEKLYRFSVEREKPDAQRKPGFQERDSNRMRETMQRLESSFDPAVDRALLEHHLARYAALPQAQRIAALDNWFGITGENYDAAAVAAKLRQMYERTTLGETDIRLDLLDATPDAFRQSKDPFIQLAVALYDSDMDLEQRAEDFAGRFQYARSQYVSALKTWMASQGRPMYADANSTLRVTYGKVQGYKPRDAVQYEPFTTLQGIVEKHTGQPPFDSPPALLAAISQRSFGRYADQDDSTVPVNFLTTLDSTGGNSGSAVLDAKGELVGLLFDGNYESINADWYFDPAITRTICVDMRYVLWVMDSVDGAHHLLREMGIGPTSLRATSD